MLGAKGIIAIVQLVVFGPSVVLAAVICARHGFSRNAGWIYILLLTLTRCAGATYQLVYDAQPSQSLAIAVVVLNSVIISPLLLSLLGLLSRYVDAQNRTDSKPLFLPWHFTGIQLVVIIGLIVTAVGASTGTQTSTQPDTQPISVPVTSKVSYALYFAALAAIILIWMMTLPGAGLAPPKERRIVVVVGMLFPLVIVRLVYSACSVFLDAAGRAMFSIFSGSVVLWASMAVWEEMVICLALLYLGLSLDKLRPEQKGAIQGRPSRFARRRRRR